MNKLPKEKRDKILYIAAGTLGLCAAIWFFLVNSQRERLQATAEQTAASRTQVEKAQVAIASKDKLQAQVAEFTGLLEQQENAMAAGDLYAWVIQTMNRFKTGYAVDIPQFSREQPAEVGLFPVYPYKAAIFNVRGTAYYHDLGKFLADFENAFPYVRVQNLELEPNTTQTSDDPEKLSFKMELLTLVKPTAL